MVWGYANMVVNNPELRDLFANLGVVGQADQAVKAVTEQQGFDRNVFFAMALLVSYYYTMRPYRPYEEVG